MIFAGDCRPSFVLVDSCLELAANALQEAQVDLLTWLLRRMGDGARSLKDRVARQRAACLLWRLLPGAPEVLDRAKVQLQSLAKARNGGRSLKWRGFFGKIGETHGKSMKNSRFQAHSHWNSVGFRMRNHGNPMEIGLNVLNPMPACCPDLGCVRIRRRPFGWRLSAA